MGTQPWPRFDAQEKPEISVQPADDTEPVMAAEIASQHVFAFWDRIDL
jgi:hypothetical protein